MHTHAHTHARTRTHIRTRMHAHTHACARTHKHAHRQRDKRLLARARPCSQGTSEALTPVRGEASEDQRWCPPTHGDDEESAPPWPLYVCVQNCNVAISDQLQEDAQVTLSGGATRDPESPNPFLQSLATIVVHHMAEKVGRRAGVLPAACMRGIAAAAPAAAWAHAWGAVAVQLWPPSLASPGQCCVVAALGGAIFKGQPRSAPC